MASIVAVRIGPGKPASARTGGETLDYAGCKKPTTGGVVPHTSRPSGPPPIKSVPAVLARGPALGAVILGPRDVLGHFVA